MIIAKEINADKYSNAETFRDLDSKCDESLKQIRQNRYGEELVDDFYQKVIRYGVAFYKKACKVKMVEVLIP